METKVIVLATVMCAVLLVSQVAGEPLQDTLPDTTGLFFGKRGSHPNMNNLLFGRRSYEAQLAAKLDNIDEAKRYCQAVTNTCGKWGFEEK